MTTLNFLHRVAPVWGSQEEDATAPLILHQHAFPLDHSHIRLSEMATATTANHHHKFRSRAVTQVTISF